MHDPKQILKKWAEDNQLIQSLCVIDGFDRVQIEESRAIEVVLQLVEPNRRPGITSKHFKEFDSHKQAWTDELVYHTGLSNIILHPSGHPLAVNRHMEMLYSRPRSPEEIEYQKKWFQK